MSADDLARDGDRGDGVVCSQAKRKRKRAKEKGSKFDFVIG